MVVHNSIVTNLDEVRADLCNREVPRHVAVIMDGNGRWAKKRSLPRSAGHKAGAKVAENFVKECFDCGVEYVTLFAFSSENWQRPANEVRDLMSLFRHYLKNDIQQFISHGIRIRFIGDFSQLDDDIIASMNKVMDITKQYEKNLTIAISYGGRLDICCAIQGIMYDYAKGNVNLEKIDDALVNSYLMTSQLPEPDLFIRTGGEHRVSNFMLWQLAYTELYFSDRMWPDFNVQEVRKALQEYAKRERRYGK